MLRRLERRFGKYAISNLTLFLVVGQLAAYVLSLTKPAFAAKLVLVPTLVLGGEVWRLVSFMFMPPASGLFGMVGVFITLYVTFLFGRSLESHWGDFRFNLFVGCLWALTTLGGFVTPYVVTSNVGLYSSFLVAFAYLSPDFEIRLMFILPIKVKWLGWLTWFGWIAMFGAGLAYGHLEWTLGIAAAIATFLLFFGNDIYLRLRGVSRRAAKVQRDRVEASTANHRCTTCGVTDLDDPQMSFRYCSKCSGRHAYCKDHLKDHEHVVE